MSLPEFNHPFNVYELQAVVHAIEKGRVTDAFVIDVREDFEVAAVAPISHALVIPMRDVAKAFSMWGSEFQSKYKSRKPGKKDRIVVYAFNARRADAGATLITAQGYKRVVCLNATYAEYLEQTQNELDEDL